jgi:voltage-gated potassium channel
MPHSSASTAMACSTWMPTIGRAGTDPCSQDADTDNARSVRSNRSRQIDTGKYGIRLYLAPSKRHFVSHNIIDLLFVLIPFLRPLRVLRSARAFSVLRAARGTVILLRAIKAVQDVLKRHKLGYTLLIALVVVVGSGLLVATIEEASPDRNIKSIPDGLWWAVTTITTVGYGDRFPVTAIGRAIGAGVMILGIGLFGLLAASLASLLVEKDLEREIDPQISEMNERLERMEQLLERLQPSDEGTQTPDAH